MKKNIYLAGKVKSDYHNRQGGWRFELIKELFFTDIEISLSDCDADFQNSKLVSINSRLNYAGPFLYGCDHGCSHRIDYAHGVLTCNNMPQNDNPNYEVLQVSFAEPKTKTIIYFE